VESRTVRYHFDDIGAAADTLAAVLLDARSTDSKYEFGGLTAPEILVGGLVITGELTSLIGKLDSIPGAVRYDE
jgi:hypothetical protein